MRRKLSSIIIVAVVAVLALSVGLAVALGQGGSTLPTLTPAQLLTKMADSSAQVKAVNGDVAWTNDLLGTGGLQLPGADTGVASLLKGGTGRFWYQDGKVRLESQGQNGDTALVMNGSTLWLYSSQESTATEVTLPAMPAKGETTPTSEAALTDPLKQIQGMIDKLAPYATLAVTQEKVANVDSYVLTLTPTATNTVFGSVAVAIDGQRFVPLRVQVFAKGSDKAVVSLGFTRVSYDPVDANIFEFTPPPGTKVDHKAVTLPAWMTDTLKSAAAPGGVPGTDQAAEATPLTVAEAQAKTGFDLLVPKTDSPSLPFGGAHVIPAHQQSAPVAVLAYGKGFGSVLVIETKVTPDQMAQLSKSLAKVPLLGQLSLNGGRPAYQISTALGSAIAWQQGDLVVLVAGSVSQADLSTFAAGIQ